MNVWSIPVPYNQPRRIASFSRQNVLRPIISIPLRETFSLRVSGEIPHLPHPSHPPPPHLQPSLPKTPFIAKNNPVHRRGAKKAKKTGGRKNEKFEDYVFHLPSLQFLTFR